MPEVLTKQNNYPSYNKKRVKPKKNKFSAKVRKMFYRVYKSILKFTNFFFRSWKYLTWQKLWSPWVLTTKCLELHRLGIIVPIRKYFLYKTVYFKYCTSPQVKCFLLIWIFLHDGWRKLVYTFIDSTCRSL